ncbi:MAG: hypothetical protein GY719_04600 [bacterium]|nr:hypothetical protein [bacterium]
MPRSAVGVALHTLLCLGFGVAAGGQTNSPPTFFLDPASGNIDDRVAVAVYPARYANGKPAEFFVPDGFEVHLTPAEDPSQELVFPCGTWFQPPPDRYRVWVAGNGLMSPYTSMLTYAGGVFKGSGLTAAVPVGEAGRVVLPPDLEAEANIVLRLLHAGRYVEAGFARRELSRRRPADQIGEGVLMPAGPTVAALWDEQTGRYTALTVPFDVLAGEIVVAPLERPKGVAQAIVQLQRHKKADRETGYDVQMSVTIDGVARTPDLKVPTSKIVYALWYSLPPGEAEISAQSSSMVLTPQKLNLGAGEITRFVGRLEPWPDLDPEPAWTEGP